MERELNMVCLIVFFFFYVSKCLVGQVVGGPSNDRQLEGPGNHYGLFNMARESDHQI